MSQTEESKVSMTESKRRRRSQITQTLEIAHLPLASLAFDFIFRSTGDGILIASKEKATITQVNPAALAMLAVADEELIGKTAEECFRQNPALLNLFARAGEQTLDVRLPKRRLAVGVGYTLPGGERIVLLQDVTEKRELESRRESLSNTIRHDLRNPISAIGGFAELITKYGELNEAQQRFVSRIRQTASKLYDVIESLVDLSWIEAGMPLAHRPTQMSTVIDKGVSRISAQALERHATIAISVQTPLPMIMGDAERLQMVIFHLLQNAILYSAEESTVAIHAWGDDSDVYCSVADRGIGIADDELERVFDRMYRSQDERVRDTPGGGLGLTIAKTIIQRHGGDIWAASNLGQGSTFTFRLPTVRL
jgi:signal transduction histidine kinase